MKIIVDMYGGDNAPLAPLRGSAMAAEKYGVDIVAVGNENEMRKICAEENIDTSRFEFVDAPLIMPVCEDPVKAVKEYKDSSLSKGLSLLHDGAGDAYVGAGSTGAIVVAATLLVKRIKGIKRAALATVIPGFNKDYMLLDLGANVECRPEMLCQFGLMGSIYMEKIEGRQNPSVALVNIGAEESKGTDLQKESYSLMKKAPYNFVGNIEPRYIPDGGADVVVADGWSGNIVLKLTEGLGTGFAKMVKGMFMKNIFTKLSALSLKGGISDFKAKMDYTKRGGAPLLGIAKPVIKAHGSSNAEAFMNAIRQAKAFFDNRIIETIEENISDMKEENEDGKSES